MSKVRDEGKGAMSKLRKIISGGQTGVDQGALFAAMKLRIPVGGWAPNGFRCEDGTIPKKYIDHMNEAPTSNYPQRTKMNVRDSDATIIFCHDVRVSRGTELTIELCKKLGKPWFDMVAETNMFQDNDDGYDHFASLLVDFRVINVAGSRESKFPGIYESSRDRLLEVFRRLRG